MAEKDAYKKMAENVMEWLKKRNMEAFYCADKSEAFELVLKLMEKKGSVSWVAPTRFASLGC